MKRILFCAAVVALAAACTNEDDLVMNQDNSRIKGLTFDVTLAEGATTRGEISKDDAGKYPFSWYAETDRINIFAINVAADAANIADKGLATADATTGVWDITNDASAYKATVSSGAGLFTAANDEDWLQLPTYDEATANLTTATIVATYGDIELKSATSEVKSTKVVPGQLTSLVVTTGTGNAAQTVARANAVDAPMYSVSTAIKEKANNSLGEKANLRLLRLFPTVRFTTKNTKDYIKAFGQLKSVELVAQGTKNADGSVDVAASTLAFDAAKDYTVIGTTVGFAGSYAAAAPGTVKVSLTDGTWTDNDAVYMTVAPVSRKAFSDKSQKEPLKVTYQFQNITFVLDAAREDATAFEKEYATENDWIAADDKDVNIVIPGPALDINNYNYLVTTTNELIVLKGSFKDVINKAGKIDWNGGAGVELSAITKIISNVELKDAELATIKKFTGLKDLTLKENASIPANTFTTAQSGAIQNLNLPKVTSIDAKFINNVDGGAFAKLDSLAMPMYAFETIAINNAFFNDDVKATLRTLDISGVTSMMTSFGNDRELSFAGYELLKKVTVKDGVEVSSKAFAGCVALETIIGKLNIAKAPGAFVMTTSKPNVVLTSVEVADTKIPSQAFSYCKMLETVKYNGSNVVPTAIGESAFEGAEKVKYMDLSSVATIGASAFKGSGITSTNDKITTLTVGATELPANIFNGCTDLKMIEFTKATKITGIKIFEGATALTQIKFLQVFTVADLTTEADDYYKDVFTTARNGMIELWPNAAQKGINDDVLTLSFKKGTAAKTQALTFKNIRD